MAFGCADNTLRAVDAATGKQVLFGGPTTTGCWARSSRDSRYLISISRDRSVKLTEVETQRSIDNITSITPGALKGGLMALARNPNKNEVKVVNTAAGTDKTEKLYDEVVLAGSDGIPRLYKVHRTQKRVIGDDFNKIREYQAMPGRIHSLSFNPDGGLFAAGSSLDGKGEVRVYLTADARVVSLRGAEQRHLRRGLPSPGHGDRLGRLRRHHPAERSGHRQAGQGVCAGAADHGGEITCFVENHVGWVE